jgi:hypothetical protein
MNPQAITRTRPGRWDGCQPLTNDERRAQWAQRYFAGGHHHKTQKPRIRLTPERAEKPA